jgi:hypothetical protein
MFITNEQGQVLPADELKRDIVDNIDRIARPDTATLEAELENYYALALNKHTKELSLTIASMPSLAGKGGGILNKIKKFVCSIIGDKSTTGEVADAVLQAITSIIPGGIIIKVVVEKIVKLIVSQGVGAFCNA